VTAMLSRPCRKQKTSQAMYVWRNIQASSCNLSCIRQAMSITYYGCAFIALGIQHATRMRRIVISGLPDSTIFSMLSHKQHDFQKKVTEHKMCVLIFSTAFVWNISHSKKKWARCDQKMYIGLHAKYPLLLSELNETIFSRDFLETLKYQFLLLHRVFWNLKLFTHQQMHYLLNLEGFNFTL
jgi:hypothetical protein